ncbi:MAG: hypothetical protein KDK91_03635, partial [Gammaproteobacteria bacterium]|nr:hypothetical protein [Gammaproteobacteria bacterium]
MLSPYLERPHEAIAYLVLRAWTAAPGTYAERLAQYLIDDPRRLKVGYSSWGGGNVGAGMASGFRSIEAVRVASRECSTQAFNDLEATIVGIRDELESKTPRWRGLRQLQLLVAMDQDRLGPTGRSKLAELRAKFPGVTHEPPQAPEVKCVGSPIPADAQEKMTDDQWLSAMARYAGTDRRAARDFEEGGEEELARALQSNAQTNPKRFSDLTARMSTELPAVYFDAVLRGLSATPPPIDGSVASMSLSDA